jgi:hypothetical protein
MPTIADTPWSSWPFHDLKDGAGLVRCPSKVFNANAAWLVLAALAHNVLRWTAKLGGLADGPVVAKTLRRRYLTIPGRLTRSARKCTLHLPARWPWSSSPRHCNDSARYRTLLTDPTPETLPRQHPRPQPAHTRSPDRSPRLPRPRDGQGPVRQAYPRLREALPHPLNPSSPSGGRPTEAKRWIQAKGRIPMDSSKT